MNKQPPEVIIAALAFIGVWLAIVLVILILGSYSQKIAAFRQRMLAQWKPALLMSGVFIVCLGLGGSSWLNPYAIAIFCQVMIGLAVASTIPGFNPTPVSQAIKDHRYVALQIASVFATAFLAVIPAVIIGTVGMSIGRQIFGEVTNTQQAISSMPTSNKWLMFFPLLGGAGIAEEATYRLVTLAVIWKLTNRKWLSIVISSVLFAAYHLSPLDSMYRVFWQFPISQFTASALIGLVWGYLFTKRGFGTAVLGHTLSDWLPMMVFT